MEVSVGQCRCKGQTAALSKLAKDSFGPKVANYFFYNKIIFLWQINFSFITSRSLEQDVPGLCNAKCEKGRFSPEDFTVDTSGCNTAAQHCFLNGL